MLRSAKPDVRKIHFKTFSDSTVPYVPILLFSPLSFCELVKLGFFYPVARPAFTGPLSFPGKTPTFSAFLRSWCFFGTIPFFFFFFHMAEHREELPSPARRDLVWDLVRASRYTSATLSCERCILFFPVSFFPWFSEQFQQWLTHRAFPRL